MRQERQGRNNGVFFSRASNRLFSQFPRGAAMARPLRKRRRYAAILGLCDVRLGRHERLTDFRRLGLVDVFFDRSGRRQVLGDRE